MSIMKRSKKWVVTDGTPQVSLVGLEKNNSLEKKWLIP